MKRNIKRLFAPRFESAFKYSKPHYNWRTATGTHSTRLGSGYYNNRRHSYVRR